MHTKIQSSLTRGVVSAVACTALNCVVGKLANRFSIETLGGVSVGQATALGMLSGASSFVSESLPDSYQKNGLLKVVAYIGTAGLLAWAVHTQKIGSRLRMPVKTLVGFLAIDAAALAIEAADLFVRRYFRARQGPPLAKIHTMPLGVIGSACLIFQYLDDKSQVRMTAVCRQTRDLVMNPCVKQTEFPKPIWDALMWRARRTDTCSDSITLGDHASCLRIKRDDFIQIVGLWHYVLVGINREASSGSSAIMPAENGKENYEQLIKKFSAIVLENIYRAITNILRGLEKEKAYLELVKAHFEKAYSIILNMPSGLEKAKACLELVKACIESKEFEKARFIILNMPSGLEKAKAYLELMKAHIESKEFEKAHAVIRGIHAVITEMPSGPEKAKAYLELAKIIRSLAAWNEVRAIIKAMPDNFEKALVQQELAEETQSKDDWDEVRAIISRMPEDHDKAKALTKLAQATQQRVDQDAAKTLVAITSSSTNARIMTEYENKEAIIESGNFEAARAIIANMERGRNQALAQLELAKAFISIGNLYKACAVIVAIRDDYCEVVAKIELWKALEDKG